ncbi:MAG: sigma-54 dependent transcriptional regulator [Spirochaetes bacterium]|nr:sigma-54 dependent transcriptional regulator [Spirochaetota bacterium]
MNNLKILIIDDEISIIQILQKYLEKLSYEIHFAVNPHKAFEILREFPIDIVILDIHLPEMSGINVLEILKTEYPEIEVIMITGLDDSQKIIKVMELGAFDYFYKPLNLVDIKHAIERTSKYLMVQKKLNQARGAYHNLTSYFQNKAGDIIIGTSKAIKEVLDLSLRAAHSDNTSVLICGSSGSGKEMIARTIHSMSNRKSSFLYSINCAAIPENLIESEFFGHEKGAFTGAVENKTGCFEAANNGTLFIDEIGDMPLAAQSKLLRVKKKKKVKKIGSQKEIEINTRIISATNHNLKQMIDEKKFRLDLYYRLNTLEIHIPPLKERREDIPQLLDYYIQYYSKELSKKINTISKEVYEMLNLYDFPGNVRELRNMAERAAILCDSDNLKLKHFPIKEMRFLSDQNGKSSNLIASEIKKTEEVESSDFEREEIIKVLSACNGNKTIAAEQLGISRYSLYRKLKKYDLK